MISSRVEFVWSPHVSSLCDLLVCWVCVISLRIEFVWFCQPNDNFNANFIIIPAISISVFVGVEVIMMSVLFFCCYHLSRYFVISLLLNELSFCRRFWNFWLLSDLKLSLGLKSCQELLLTPCIVVLPLTSVCYNFIVSNRSYQCRHRNYQCRHSCYVVDISPKSIKSTSLSLSIAWDGVGVLLLATALSYCNVDTKLTPCPTTEQH